MRFAWDPDKNIENKRRHGISFHAARAVFQDPNHIDDLDDRDYGEERWVAIGELGPIVAYVVYTDRGDVRRLISARKATPDEKARYRSRWR